MLTDYDKKLIREVNQLRTNPVQYAEKLIKSKTYFKGKVWEHPDLKAGTVEGLIPSKGLMKVAKDMCNCYARDKEFDIDATIEKYGEFDGEFGSLIEYGGRTPEMSVMNLLVCDGDKTRQHRKTLFEPTVKKIGVSNGTHKIFKTISVVVTADVFENKVDKIDKIFF